MAVGRWKILLVEDDREDYLLTKEMLAEARGRKYLLEWASDYESGKQAILLTSFDAILMDYDLGRKSGIDLTREVSALGCKSPIILLTGRGNYEVDMEAMQNGVTDYLSKSESTPSTLERAIRYAILQKQTEEELRAAKEELEARVQERTRELLNKNFDLEAEIKERKRIEAELAEMQRGMMDRTEAEYRELARDLHDGPMQDLYGLVFQLETLPTDFMEGKGGETTSAMKGKLLQVIQSLRTISRELRPPALAPYGLEKAIRSHAEYLQQAHPDLHIYLHLENDGKKLPETTRLSLFRIYQTAVTNIIRHAQATQAEIRFSLTPQVVRLEIGDNGCGFDVPSRWIELARQGHMGLVGAAERAEAIGGKMHVESNIGKGTMISVLVPRKTNKSDNSV